MDITMTCWSCIFLTLPVVMARCVTHRDLGRCKVVIGMSLWGLWAIWIFTNSTKYLGLFNITRELQFADIELMFSQVVLEFNASGMLLSGDKNFFTRYSSSQNTSISDFDITILIKSSRHNVWLVEVGLEGREVKCSCFFLSLHGWQVYEVMLCRTGYIGPVYQGSYYYLELTSCQV